MMSLTSKTIRVRKLDFLLSHVGVVTFSPFEMMVNFGRKNVSWTSKTEAGKTCSTYHRSCVDTQWSVSRSMKCSICVVGKYRQHRTSKEQMAHFCYSGFGQPSRVFLLVQYCPMCWIKSIDTGLLCPNTAFNSFTQKNWS